MHRSALCGVVLCSPVWRGLVQPCLCGSCSCCVGCSCCVVVLVLCGGARAVWWCPCCVVVHVLCSRLLALLVHSQPSLSVCCAARAGQRGRVRSTFSTQLATLWMKAPCAVRDTAARSVVQEVIKWAWHFLFIPSNLLHRGSVSRQPQILALDCLASLPI